MFVFLKRYTTSESYSGVRDIIPQNVPILLAGIGSQGGNLEVMKMLLDQNKRGVFVNSSRGILYPYESTDSQWKERIHEAVITLKNELNEIRK